MPFHIARLAARLAAAAIAGSAVSAASEDLDNVVETVRLSVEAAAPDTSASAKSVPSDSLAAEIPVDFIEGSIDWTTHILTVYGEAVAPDGIANAVQQRLMGFRGAKVDARRNLLEMVGEVRVDAQTTVNMAMVDSDVVRSTVSGIVRGARVLPGSQTIEDGLYRIALQVDLRNQFAAALLPDLTRPESEPMQPDTTATAPDSLASPADEMRVFTPPPPFTGLLLDARGLGLQPSMAPRIVSASGHEIYSAGFAERDYVSQIGVVGYDKEMDRALVSDRLGGEEANPLLVEATGVAGTFSGDAVVSDGEALRIRVADAEDDFLSHCRVVFLVGPRPVVIDSTFIDSLYLDSLDVDYIDSLDVDAELPSGKFDDFSATPESGDRPE